MHKFCYITLFCFLFSCTGNKKTVLPDESTTRKDTVENLAGDSTVTAQKKWNNLASFIAGSSVGVESEFALLAQTDEWQSYHQQMDSLWAGFELKTQSIKSWQQQNLPGIADTVFYPFSGPDIPYLLLFYPDASCYYLLALEPAGSVLPSPAWKETHSPDDLNKIYGLYSKTVSCILSSSFFKTEDMQEDFSGADMDGVLPVLIMLLNRTGNEILSVLPGSPDEKGTFVINNANKEGVEIVFRKRHEEKIKRLHYISCNLSNRGIALNKPLQALLEKKDAGVLVKSASYLMHNAGFSRIRNTLLKNAALLVQDDSGIPYTAFSPSTWDINLYGHYSKPIFLFRRYFQKELADAYKDSLQIHPVDFRFGYEVESNLLIAKKR